MDRTHHRHLAPARKLEYTPAQPWTMALRSIFGQRVIYGRTTWTRPLRPSAIAAPQRHALALRQQGGEGLSPPLGHQRIVGTTDHLTGPQVERLTGPATAAGGLQLIG